MRDHFPSISQLFNTVLICRHNTLLSEEKEHILYELWDYQYESVCGDIWGAPKVSPTLRHKSRTNYCTFPYLLFQGDEQCLRRPRRTDARDSSTQNKASFEIRCCANTIGRFTMTGNFFVAVRQRTGRGTYEHDDSSLARSSHFSCVCQSTVEWVCSSFRKKEIIDEIHLAWMRKLLPSVVKSRCSIDCDQTRNQPVNIQLWNPVSIFYKLHMFGLIALQLGQYTFSED
jgi:hypothetical protein